MEFRKPLNPYGGEECVVQIIVYSKAGCHLCAGLLEKLSTVQAQATDLTFSIVTRDITTREAWFQRYQYEIPVTFLAPSSLTDEDDPADPSTGAIALPRLSPRSSAARAEKWLRNHWPA